MSTQVDHMEVAPRMWDKSIAASYVSKKSEPEQLNESNGSSEHISISAERAADAIPSLFDRLKTY